MATHSIFTAQEIHERITHPDYEVRQRLATTLGFIATAEQAELGLSDPNEYVREIWVERMDFVHTPAQAERGLSDPFLPIQRQWRKRLSETTNATPASIESHLTAEAVWIRGPWVRQTCFTPTPPQAVRGLLDGSSHVRDAWESRHDLQLSLEQLAHVIQTRNTQNYAPLSPKLEHELRTQAEKRMLTQTISGNMSHETSVSKPPLRGSAL